MFKKVNEHRISSRGDHNSACNSTLTSQDEVRDNIKIPKVLGREDSSSNTKVGIRQFAKSIYHWTSSYEPEYKAARSLTTIDPSLEAIPATPKAISDAGLFDFTNFTIKDEISTKNFQTRGDESITLRNKSNSFNNVTSYNSHPATFSSSLLKNLEKPITPSSQKKRVIVIQNIPSTAGLSSIIAQVCGGPLERINFHKERGPNNGSSAELYFLFPEDASNFFNYATMTNFFVVNGNKLKVEWASRLNTDDLDEFHPRLPSFLLKEVLHWGARRCLVFSKVIPTKTIRNSPNLHYPSAKTHFSKDLDIEVVKKDMSLFGEIVEIGPVISRKLCFSVHFADVRSAIVAKKICETAGSSLYSTYSDWSLWFGKDPTDLPCRKN